MSASPFLPLPFAGFLFVASLLFAPPVGAVGRAAFVDLPTGLIIGAYSDGKWIQSEAAGKAIQPGKKYRLFDLSGKLGEAVGGPVGQNTEVCPDLWDQKLKPETEKRAVAVDLPWNPLPRKAKAADTTQEVYQKAAFEFLTEKGIKNPVVKIAQLLRVDLDGDGEDEVLLSATNYPGEAGESPSEAQAGNYSFVLLRQIVGGKVLTRLVDGQFFPKGSESEPSYRYEVLALLDLDGDGHLEVIVNSAYYEGATTTIWKLRASQLRKVLEIGCGA